MVVDHSHDFVIFLCGYTSVCVCVHVCARVHVRVHVCLEYTCLVAGICVVSSVHGCSERCCHEYLMAYLLVNTYPFL